jgi:hypothetical protein
MKFIYKKYTEYEPARGTIAGKNTAYVLCLFPGPYVEQKHNAYEEQHGGPLCTACAAISVITASHPGRMAVVFNRNKNKYSLKQIKQ